MRKLFTTAAIFAMSITMMQAQVIFDPGSYPAENLGDGMEIVNIDGTDYLKVALNGWNTSVVLDDSIMIAEDHTFMRAMVMYKEGTSGYTYDQVNTFLKLANSDWGDVATIGAGSTLEFSEFTNESVPTGLYVYAFQFAGQETSSWGAVTGDTMYIGRVTVEDPNAILDPVITTTSDLPAGWSLDTIDGDVYYQILLDGWNSGWHFSNSPYGAVRTPEGVMAVKTMAKYAVGTSGYPLEGVNTFLKFSNVDWGEIAANGSASSAEFAKYALAMIPDTVLGVLQPAGQETTSWGAIAGDTLWVGAWYPDLVESVSISAEGDATTIETIQGTLQLTAEVMPVDAYNDTVSWSSSDEAIATVDDTGLVSAVEDGSVTITAMTQDGSELSATYDITVSNQHDAIANRNYNPLVIYPNPVEDIMYVKNTATVYNLEIFDMSGKKVLSVNDLSERSGIDISDLSKGVYVVRAQHGTDIQTIKLVK